MVKKINKDVQPQTQTYEVYRVKRRVIILCIIPLSMLLMGCWVYNLFVEYSRGNFVEYDGPDAIVSDTPETYHNTGETVKTPEVEEVAEGAETSNVGTNEFSVSAQDFNCICQVDGNVNVELLVNGDQLEIIDANGSVQVYDKIGENTYKRSWMGYYILLIDGQETKVDEEKSVVIILNNNGYVKEHYSGSDSSPCCIHTFTQTD